MTYGCGGVDGWLHFFFFLHSLYICCNVSHHLCPHPVVYSIFLKFSNSILPLCLSKLIYALVAFSANTLFIFINVQCVNLACKYNYNFDTWP